MSGEFTVEHVQREYDWQSPDTPEGWCVYLPHQCEDWQIVSEYGDWEPVPHDVAVARMTQFVADAQDALEELKRRGETDEHR